MGYRKVVDSIDQLRELVAGWDGRSLSEVSSIEMSMALDRVKRIYEQLRFPSQEEPEVVVVAEERAPEPEAIVVVEVPEPVVEPEPELVVESEPEPEAVVEEQPDTLQRKRERYKKIMSLYTDPVEEPQEIPAILQRKVAPKSNSHASDNIELLADELFGGDRAALSEALSNLNSCASLDDAIIYISDHYSWDGNSEGAKLLFQLLQRRFSNNTK